MYRSALTLPAELSISGVIGLCRVSSTAPKALPAAPPTLRTSAGWGTRIGSVGGYGRPGPSAGQHERWGPSLRARLLRLERRVFADSPVLVGTSRCFAWEKSSIYTAAAV